MPAHVTFPEHWRRRGGPPLLTSELFSPALWAEHNQRHIVVVLPAVETGPPFCVDVGLLAAVLADKAGRVSRGG